MMRERWCGRCRLNLDNCECARCCCDYFSAGECGAPCRDEGDWCDDCDRKWRTMVPPTLTHGSLFSGIGGIDLGLESTRMFSTRFNCEIDPWCRLVLKSHFPGVHQYDDVRTLRGDALPPVDVLSFGFPCQDISVAGKQAGLSGERSGLFFEVMRIVREMPEPPTYLIAENVHQLLSGFDEVSSDGVCKAFVGAMGDAPAGSVRHYWMGTVLRELSALGYDAVWDCIPASSVGARHQRDRVFIVAIRRGVSDVNRDLVRKFWEWDREQHEEPWASIIADDGPHFDSDAASEPERESHDEAYAEPAERDARHVARRVGEHPDTDSIGREPEPPRDGAQRNVEVESGRDAAGRGPDDESGGARTGDVSDDVRDAARIGMEGHRPAGEQEPRAPAEEGLSGRAGAARGAGDHEVEPALGGAPHGISMRLDGTAWAPGWDHGVPPGIPTGDATDDWELAIGGLGNAVVPHVAKRVGICLARFHSRRRDL